MRYFLEFLVIGLVFFLNTIQHSETGCTAKYRTSYACYKPKQMSKTIYGNCRTVWRWWRCKRHVSYYNTYIKSTCYKYHPCPSNYGWSGWGSWGSWGSCQYPSSNPYRYRYKYNKCGPSNSNCCSCGSYGRKLSTYSNQKCTHGSWSSWGSWKKTGSCSASCRKCGSSQYPRQRYYKYRTCTSPRPSNGGRSCSGSSYAYKYYNCNSHYCKVYGGWSKWYNGNWRSCSASCKKCGSNTNPTQSQRRYRYCNNPSPACGGSSCPGTSSYYSSKVCNTHYCKVNGGWSSWYFSGSWSSCSASCRTCGSSVIPLQSRTRRRSCNNPSPGCGGRSCSGSTSSTTSRYCNTAYCKVNGGWSGWKSWGSWDKCSAECKTCGSSSNPYKTRRRYRVCNNPTPRCNGNSCPGSKYITSSTSCNTHYCKVNGGWSSWKPWGSWGSCSTVCKPCGSSTDPTKTRRRYRACNNPTPACNGHSCSGRSYISASKSCNTHYCKVNGGWGSWESWTKVTNCSAECKKEGSVSPTQTVTRKRLCNNPSPSCNGQSCSGSASDKSVQNCNTQNCPVDGYWEWGNWGAWDECSKTCDSGSHKRIRYNKCIGPKYGGKSCSGKVTKTHTYHRGCNRNIPCPVDGGWASFKSWSEWTQCSRSCGGGLRERTRYRHCTNPRPLHGGKKCTGLDNDNVFEDCNTLDCPSFCTCFGYGDPHYYTPDGAEIHFMGICKYTLWKSTLPNDACSFRVETKNERRYGQTHVAYTRMIDFFIEQNKIRILQGGTTLLNGIAVGLPTTTANNSIEITRSGSYITAIHSKCNIRVQFDGSHMIDVKVSKNHFGGNLTGLCGNCNGNVKDDYQTKSGTDVSGLGWAGYASIGNSYKVLDDSDQPDLNCADAEAPGECSDKDKELAKTDDYCGYLLSDSSPFKICRDSKKVDFTKMYSSCEFDVCSSDKNDANCQTLESTALACSQHGYRVKWRSLKFCPLTCKGDFVYKTTVSCTNTCDNPKATQNCQDPPVDGCTCSDKTYLNGGKCVTIDKCGSCNLKIGGISSKLALGDVYPKGDCILSQRCDLVNGTFQLVTIPAKTSCALDEWCKTNNNGIYECTKKPINGGWQITGNWSNWSTCSKTCNGGIRKRARGRSCTNPKPQYGGASCAGSIKEISYESCNTLMCPSFCSCEGSGDPHYYTPDGAVIHFMGTCKYTLWKSTIPNDQCEFKVETKNERRYGYTHVSYTRMIDFYMGNTQIRFLHGGNVLIDGYRASLPVKTGNDSIELSRSGSFISAVHAKCNIRVQFDGYHLVNVKVSKDYFAGNLTGICGNCNGNYRDDLQTKEGIDVSSKGGQGFADIGNSYKVTDDSDLPDKNCADVPPLKDCTDDKRKFAKTDKYCGFLATDTSPFKACMDSQKVNFDQLYSSCEVDFCNSNRTYVHCQTLQTAALACSQHGFQTKWRTPTFCPLKCEGGLVYKSAISCTNTCDNPTADQNCQDPPVDGCTCPDNTFLNGDKCVTIDRCGSCTLNIGAGTSKLALGDVYPKGDCIKAQKCILKNGTFNMVSVPASISCAPDEWCKLSKLGVYKCTKKPVDGGWKKFSTFTDWSACSKTCNGGTRQRTRIRSCTVPIPQYGGKSCVGSTKETVIESCNTFKCPNAQNIIIEGDNPLVASGGVNKVIACKVVSGIANGENPDLKWYDNRGNLVPPDGRIFVIGQSATDLMLLLNNVQEDDAGSYNCTGFINGQLQSAHVVVKTKTSASETKTESVTQPKLPDAKVSTTVSLAPDIFVSTLVASPANTPYKTIKQGTSVTTSSLPEDITNELGTSEIIPEKTTIANPFPSDNSYTDHYSGPTSTENSGNFVQSTSEPEKITEETKLNYFETTSEKITPDEMTTARVLQEDDILTLTPNSSNTDMPESQSVLETTTLPSAMEKTTIDGSKIENFTAITGKTTESNPYDVILTTPRASTQGEDILLETTSRSITGSESYITTPNALDVEQATVFETKSTTTKTSNINENHNFTADSTSQSPTVPTQVSLISDETLTDATTTNVISPLDIKSSRGQTTETHRDETTSETIILPTQASLVTDEIQAEATTANGKDPGYKESSAGTTGGETTNQSNYVPTESSLITDEILKEATTANDRSLIKIDSSLGNTAESPDATTSSFNPTPDEQNLETTTTEGQTTQQALPIEDSDDTTSESNIVPTQASLITTEIPVLITTEMLAEASTTNDIIPVDTESSRGNTTENTGDTTTYTIPITEEIQVETSTTNDKTTPLHESSTPQSITIPKESEDSDETTSQSNTVPPQASTITDKIQAEATTANDISPVDKESSLGSTTETPEGTTAYFNPLTEEQQVETSTIKDQTTQLPMPSTSQLITIPKELEDSGDTTSQSITVPSETTTANDVSPVDKESSLGITTETHEGTTSNVHPTTEEQPAVTTTTKDQTTELPVSSTTNLITIPNESIDSETSESNTVRTQSSVITEEILTEATTPNDIGFVDNEISTAGNPKEKNSEATTSNSHPPTEEQQLEITTTKDQTTQPNLLSTPQMSTILKELASTAETSESNTVPTQTSIITDEILAEVTTPNDNGPINKESSAENTTENPDGTTSNFNLATEEQQVEITTAKDQTTQPTLTSTPQMSTISKELTASEGATGMTDSTQPTTTAWEQTEDQYTTLEVKDKTTTNVGSNSANKTTPGPTDILPSKAKIEGVTKAYSEFKCKTKWGYYPDPNNCAGFIQCDWGKPKRRPCAKGTIWNQTYRTCVHGSC